MATSERSNNSQAIPRTGVIVHSHLNRKKSKRIYFTGSPTVDWETKREPSSNDGEIPDEFLVVRDLSNDEFFAQLTPDKETAMRPPAPPRRALRSNERNLSEDVDQRMGGSLVFASVISALLCLGVIIAVAFALLQRANSRVDNNAFGVVEPINVSGNIWYVDSEGSFVPDQGSFIFLFPADRAFSQPLTTSGLTPREALPDNFESFKKELESRGGYFALVDFDGSFSIALRSPTDYYVLIVSRHVGDSLDAVSSEELKAISQYIYLPERKLLRNCKYSWSKRTLDRDSSQIEYEFRGAVNP